MRRYEIYGRKFIAEGEQLYVEVLEATLADEARPAKRHYKKHKKIADFPPPEKPEKKKKGSARHCAHCGKEGHLADGCPEAKRDHGEIDFNSQGNGKK